MSRLFNLGILAAAAAAPAAAAAAPLPAALHPWAGGVVYPVTTAPGRVTDLALEPGETLGGEGPVAAGDTARWIIGQSESGADATRQVHVLVKPTAPGLATNLIINTSRRSYLIDLRSTPDTWIPLVAWRYPAGELTALVGRTVGATAAAAPPLLDLDYAKLNFDWKIEGEAPFRPLRVFDDGRQTFIDFPPTVERAAMPPLFVLRAGEKAPQVANVRVRGARMIVDGVADVAELRLGDGKVMRRVRLARAQKP